MGRKDHAALGQHHGGVLNGLCQYGTDASHVVWIGKHSQQAKELAMKRSLPSANPKATGSGRQHMAGYLKLM